MTHILKGEKTGIYFIDSTKLEICHKKRTSTNKVFKGLAEVGKSSYGWFLGFKLHMVINNIGQIISIKITKGNVDDRQPVEELLKNLKGSAYADKGYISNALTDDLKEEGITLITTHRRNMKPKVLAAWDRAMLSKRFIIETINDQRKNISQIEHSCHRSLHGFMLNLLGGLIAYCLKPEKPSLNITNTEKTGLMAMA